MRSSSRSLVPVVATLVLLVARAAGAGPATDQLRVQVDRVIKVLEDPALKKDGRAPDRRAAIRQVASEIFDFNELSRRCLGRHWQARTPAEQADFTQAFTDLLEHAYVSKIEAYSGEKVQFTGEQLEGEYAMVKTKIVTPQGTEIPVDYRLYKQGDRWRAYDVNVEGVSLVANYRSQFNAILQRQSYAELMKTLRAKQAQLSQGTGKPVPPEGGAGARPGGASGGQQP